MKLSAQEEYGLRCLLHLARNSQGQSVTIPEISQAEGLSVPNVAKLMRLLRLGGIVRSCRGQAGGYTLSRPPREISVGAVLNLLGGPFFGPTFCVRHSGRTKSCTHASDCSLRAVWATIQMVLEEVLGKTTLEDLLAGEHEASEHIRHLTGAILPLCSAGIASAAAGERH